MKDDISELWSLVVAYVKQETIEPLKGLARYAAFGVAGSIVLVAGLGMLALGALRLLQDQTGTAFTGHLTWLPYCITAGLSLAVATASVAGIARAKTAESRGDSARAKAVESRTSTSKSTSKGDRP